MKKLFVMLVLGFAGYKLYQNGFGFRDQGAFDNQGKSQVVLFVGPGCGEHCEKIRSLLRDRRVAFKEIDVARSDGAPSANKYGVKNYPTTLVGSRRVLGDDMPAIKALLAESIGKDVLSRSESRAMNSHFDAGGNAQVVMYATDWCPYCKRQRQYFAVHGIDYVEIDVEKSEDGMLAYDALQGDGYPLIYVGYRRFPGYTESPLENVISDLKKAGPRL